MCTRNLYPYTNLYQPAIASLGCAKYLHLCLALCLSLRRTLCLSLHRTKCQPRAVCNLLAVVYSWAVLCVAQQAVCSSRHPKRRVWLASFVLCSDLQLLTFQWLLRFCDWHQVLLVNVVALGALDTITSDTIHPLALHRALLYLVPLCGATFDPLHV